ncbi:ATP-binding cassette domain-containing protein [Devosia nitrariae]|uniref:Thiamine import ATP-binding protein ThiQ n=1 Tax=Devosia nitrariae TaxID=2071872 RepID=A0ABQ5W9T2_9HYPH|nr:ATP-binding cassette domain-containing protein [Devosia nitrariae]GLQ56727.1 thiamine import ATP-binding protein ThiQ [Devosia nitrariae]
MLALDRLTFAHPGQREPYVFSMEALPGEVTSVSGPSGSGKSTLLDLVAGFLAPTAGTLTLDAEDLIPLDPEHRPVSLLLQSESLFEHLSAERNVALGLPSGTPDAAPRIARALKEAGLSGVGKQRASTLSGGQKQRVALARTLLRDRKVLLLDEPFSALDDDTRKVIRALVGNLTKRHGWITLLVSHHRDDVEALANRRYVIVGKTLQAK